MHPCQPGQFRQQGLEQVFAGDLAQGWAIAELVATACWKSNVGVSEGFMPQASGENRQAAANLSQGWAT